MNYRLYSSVVALQSHPWVQRLARVNQFGQLRFGYSRLPHSLEVSRLAAIAAQRICQRHAIVFPRYWIDVAATAGLLHDIGHGRGSHALDARLRERYGIAALTHEQRSMKLIHLMRYDLPVKSEDVQAMVSPALHAEDIVPEPLRYLVSSPSVEKLDVDRIDYILRDVRLFNAPFPEWRRGDMQTLLGTRDDALLTPTLDAAFLEARMWLHQYGYPKLTRSYVPTEDTDLASCLLYTEETTTHFLTRVLDDPSPVKTPPN